MRKTSSRTKTRRSGNRLPKPRARRPDKLPVIEHLYELRRRLFYSALSVGLFGMAAYAVEHHIVAALLWPAGEQAFVYTSPIDGINFLFRLCLYTGLAFSIPVFVYQFLRYLEPLFKRDSLQLIVWGSLASGVLALAGMVFGYFVGLPAALHFLLHQFVTEQIQPMLTIQAYMSFVTMYMLVSALLFQVPLFLIFINRIKPLQPKKLLSLRYERWVILGGFVLGGIMNPDPNLLHQTMIVGPLIITYQLGAGIIWLSNRRPSLSKHQVAILRQDAQVQVERQRQLKAAQTFRVVNPPSPQLRTLDATVDRPVHKNGRSIDGLVNKQRPRIALQRLPNGGESSP